MSQPTAEEHAPPGEEPTELKRVMGPKLLLLFIVGDILGTGVYALTGQVAAEVGGAAWAPFIVAFLIALITAFSYLELVTKYPQAAGAALYTHKAFGVHFLTFIVCFTVMCSGITSASTAARAVGSNLLAGFGIEGSSTWTVVAVALVFMALVAAVNLRGVGESVKANIVLTLVELSGLLFIILVGIFAAFGGKADFSRVMVFESPGDKNAFLAVTAATALAFFAMVGFEDAVNMAEETHDPVKNFPRMMIAGIGITGVIYVLVAIFTVAIVPVGELGASDTPLTLVVERALPGFPIGSIFPFITIFAVRGDRVHHGHRTRAHRARDAAGGERRHRSARRHDVAAAARRVHHRQRRGAQAAEQHRRPEALRGPDRPADPRGAALCVLRRAVDRTRPAPVPDRGLAAAHRRRPVVRHLGVQPSRAHEDHGP
jgi:amino acid permease